MGLLKFFGKSESTLLQLPSGSFTVDRSGAILTRTLPSHFPLSLVSEVAETTLEAFRSATAAHLNVSELVITYSSLRVTARAIRGGAIVFLHPKSTYTH
jgi:hypothetical protein